MKKITAALILLAIAFEGLVFAPVASAQTSASTSIQAHLDMIISLRKQIEDLRAQINSMVASLKSQTTALKQIVRESHPGSNQNNATTTCIIMKKHKNNGKHKGNDRDGDDDRRKNSRKCREIEFEWKWFNRPHATSTKSVKDTTPPIISSASATNITTTSVFISWTTNEPATSKIYLGATSPLATSTTTSIKNESLVTNHSLQITNLAPNTTYYFIVESSDRKNNKTSSAELSFKTLPIVPPPDTTAPIISSVQVQAMSTSSTVVWTTNESATSKVYVGTTSPLILGSASVVSHNTLVTAHTMTLGDLATSTTYYYVIESADASANTATTSQAFFTTLP